MFTPHCLPILIGSLPLTDHARAVELIFEHTPEIPLWPQLPTLEKEGMVRQFVSGLPGLVDQDSRCWIDTRPDAFISEMTEFYDHFMTCQILDELPEDTVFSLDNTTARGFSVFQEMLDSANLAPVSVKGQVTGPVTAGMGIKDDRGLPIIFDGSLRDMLIKLLAGKARWQVEQLRPYCSEIPPIIFIDEPSIVNFGSAAFAGVSRELVLNGVAELITSIKEAGGLSGIHICANGDWEPALNSDTDIISFDAYSFFENFILYREQLISYLKRGGILAWGIVPTAPPERVAAEQVESLHALWHTQLNRLCSFGFTESQIISRTLIAPACGTGSLSPELAVKVLSMTRNLADLIRAEFSC